MFRPPSAASLPVTLALIGLCSAASAGSPPRVEAIRYWSFGDVTRVAIQTQGEYRLTLDQVENPARVYFDLTGLRPPASAKRGGEIIQVNDQRIKQIRVAEVNPGRTRIVFDLEGPAEVVSSQLVNPDRLMIEIRPKGTSLAALSITRSATGSQRFSYPSNPSTADRGLNAAVTASTKPEPATAPPPTPGLHVDAPGSLSERTQTTSTTQPVTGQSTTVQNHGGLIVKQPSDVSRLTASSKASPSAARQVVGVAAPAKRDSSGDQSLVRVFGLKLGRVVIDPGHGGHDTGTIGPNGLMEKELVLDVALRVGKLISQQLGADVVYTRSNDTFIPLEERTKIANNEKADLFISVHANSSPEPNATGVETYFFNLNSDKHGLDLAMRENASSSSSISDLNDLLHKAVLQTKLEESREFAQKVQASLWASSLKMNSHSKDRGVRQAPFVVLIGATMPSILAEIGFVSNPHDAKLLLKEDQRQAIAQALYKGVSKYAETLSHMQMARAGAE